MVYVLHMLFSLCQSIVYGVLDVLLDGIDLFQDPGVKKVFECYMLCVRENFGGRGLGAKLTKVKNQNLRSVVCSGINSGLLSPIRVAEVVKAF